MYLLHMMAVIEYFTLVFMKILAILYLLFCVDADFHSEYCAFSLLVLLFFEISCTGVNYKLNQNLVSVIISAMFLICNIFEIIIIIYHSNTLDPFLQFLLDLTFYKCIFVIIFGFFFTYYLSKYYFSQHPNHLYWYQETMRCLLGYKSQKPSSKHKEEELLDGISLHKKFSEK